tara:strand:- start:5053 stop:5478 length:426 start_codon:yes stop_codon:yes gene_type:complete
MAFVKGEDGSVYFGASGSEGIVSNTRSWSLNITKETIDTTKQGDNSRTYIGGLVTATGSCELLYDNAASGDTLALIKDVVTADDDPSVAAGADFKLYFDGSKYIEFGGIVTSTNYSSTMGDPSTITVDFQVSGDVSLGNIV